MPLNVPKAEAEGIADKLVDAVQHGVPSTPEKEEPSDETAAAGDTESPSKRVKIHFSAEVKVWFLDLVHFKWRDTLSQRQTWTTSRRRLTRQGTA